MPSFEASENRLIIKQQTDLQSSRYPVAMDTKLLTALILKCNFMGKYYPE